MASRDIYFTDLFENTSDLIQYVTLAGEIEMVNPAWLQTLGYSAKEVVGKSIYEFVPVEERAAFITYRDACIKLKTQEEIQISYLHKNGVHVVLEGHLRPFYVDGKLRHTRGVFRNITSKKKKEKLQGEQLTRITQFLANAPDAVVIINEQQTVIEWNLKATELFGYSRDQVLNRPLSEFIIPIQFRDAHNTGMKRFLSTGVGPVLNKTIEVPAIDMNSREFPISLCISAVQVHQEWFFIGFMRDISEKKKTDQLLIQKEIELEKTQFEDRKNKEFLSIASHELRTPLTSLKAFLQIAIKGLETEPKQRIIQFLKRADDASTKLGNLIVHLLDISKIQSGKLLIDKQPVDITQLLHEVVSTSQLLYPSHRFEFKASESITVNIDRERVEQVFVNLINNAVKFSPNADLVELTIKPDKKHVEICVKDHGKGIDINNKDNVFDKFYRIEELSANQTQGLGLGLYISSEIIKQHDGDIWVENNEDGGATFHVIFPL